MRVKVQPVSYTYRRYYESDTGKNVPAETNVPYTGSRGIVVPDIVRNPKDADGFRKPSPYSCTPYTRSALVVDYVFARAWDSYHKRWNCFLTTNTGSYSTYPDPDGTARERQLPEISQKDSDFSEQYARAVNTALKQLSNNKGHILETVVELRSSLQGLARNARSIVAFSEGYYEATTHGTTKRWQKLFGIPKEHRKLREWRRKLNSGSIAARSFGSAWLTFWFGLAPIVDDMVLCMAALTDENFFKRNLSGKGRGFTKSKYQKTYSVHTSTAVRMNGGWNEEMSVDREVGVYVSLLTTVDRKYIEHFLTNARALGVTEVASTAWAVVPYSWLVDFVIPVSQVLRLLEGRYGLNFKSGTVTYYQAYSNPKVEYKARPGNGLKTIECLTKPRIISGKTSFRRVVLKSLPYPVLQVKTSPSLWQATTAMSLLATRLKPLLPPSKA